MEEGLAYLVKRSAPASHGNRGIIDGLIQLSGRQRHLDLAEVEGPGLKTLEADAVSLGGIDHPIVQSVNDHCPVIGGSENEGQLASHQCLPKGPGIAPEFDSANYESLVWLTLLGAGGHRAETVVLAAQKSRPKAAFQVQVGCRKLSRHHMAI